MQRLSFSESSSDWRMEFENRNTDVDEMNTDNFSNVRRCLVCFDFHPLRHCQKFESFTPQQKLYSVRTHGYCSNCFSRSHTIGDCTSTNGCFKCGELHHTMLHGAFQAPSSTFTSDRRVTFVQPNQRSAAANNKQFATRNNKQFQGRQTQQKQNQKIKMQQQQSFAQKAKAKHMQFMEQNHQLQLAQLSELTQTQNQDQDMSDELAVESYHQPARRQQKFSPQARQQQRQGPGPQPNRRPGFQRQQQQQQKQHGKPTKKLQGINKKNSNILNNPQGTKKLLNQMITTLTRLNRALNAPI